MLSKTTAKRLVPVLALGAVAAMSLSGGASAARTAKAPEHVTIAAKGHTEQGLHYPKVTEVAKGGTITLVNQTPAPHTLSLVRKHLVPKTNGQIKKCNAPGHICRKIGKWHQFGPEGAQKNPVRVGKHGWSTEGNLHHKGDSVIFGNGVPAPHAPATREVHAAHGTVLHFICAIHPWMHGKIVVE
jgi:plastocyanin